MYETIDGFEIKKKKIPEKLRISVLDKDGRKCLWCGRSAVDVSF